MSEVPAGWYADPVRRFETRYWDGVGWTEHVSRGGQQGLDPIAPAVVPADQAGSLSTGDGMEQQPMPGENPWLSKTPSPEPPPPAPPAPPTPPAPASYAPPGPYYASAPVQATVAGLAIASMVLGILWIYWIGSLLAIIFGHIALRQIRKSNGWKTGRGMAIAGVVLGYVGMATFVLFVVVAIAASNSRSHININGDAPDGHCNQSRYIEDPDCG